MANVQKSLKGASTEADFWHGESINYAVKKTPLNNDVGWGPLHSEIGLPSLTKTTSNSCNQDFWSQLCQPDQKYQINIPTLYQPIQQWFLLCVLCRKQKKKGEFHNWLILFYFTKFNSNVKLITLFTNIYLVKFISNILCRFSLIVFLFLASRLKELHAALVKNTCIDKHRAISTTILASS